MDELRAELGLGICKIPVNMEELVKNWSAWLASGIEVGAAILIGLAALQAIIESALVFVRQRFSPPGTKEEIRLKLGRWLTLALELEVAADILRTAVSPTWNDLGQLAAIVVLRTILNYFLQNEIDRARA